MRLSQSQGLCLQHALSLKKDRLDRECGLHPDRPPAKEVSAPASTRRCAASAEGIARLSATPVSHAPKGSVWFIPARVVQNRGLENGLARANTGRSAPNVVAIDSRSTTHVKPRQMVIGLSVQVNAAMAVAGGNRILMTRSGDGVQPSPYYVGIEILCAQWPTFVLNCGLQAIIKTPENERPIKKVYIGNFQRKGFRRASAAGHGR